MNEIKFMCGNIEFTYDSVSFKIISKNKVVLSGNIRDLYLFHYSYEESKLAGRGGKQLNATIKHEKFSQSLNIAKNGTHKDINQAKVFCELIMKIGNYEEKGFLKSSFASIENQTKKETNAESRSVDFYNDLKRLPGFDSWGTKKEIRYLKDMLYEGEQVFAIASGIMGGNTWLLACTSKRVIFVDCGMIYGVRHSEVMIDRINAVSFKNGLILGEIHIEDGASTRIISSVSKTSTKPFVDAVHRAIDLSKKNSNASVSNISNADEILKFKKLYDSGIITKEEFKQQKRKLLDM